MKHITKARQLIYFIVLEFVFLIGLMAVLTLSPVSAYAIGIKEHSVITSDTITLGDVFYDLPHSEERVLGASPRPGHDMVLNARTLLRIAVALDLDWRPSSTADRVTVKRDATVIGYDQIKENLYTALYDESIYGNYELGIPAQFHKIVLPHDQPATMVITDFSVDTQQKKFEATIAAPNAENPIQHLKIKGNIEPVIKVPVLLENIQTGHIIQRNDIEYINLKERDFSKGTVADGEMLVGMTARRLLIAGRPIKTHELVSPKIVERGELVTLSLKTGPMRLTTQAKALEHGAKGDIIRVVNTASNTTLQARVVNQKEVTLISN